jgi:type VI secretion system protein ImpF
VTARPVSGRRSLASVLDRLVDEGTWGVLGRAAGKGAPQGGSIRASVERDLGLLLNTRRPAISWPPGSEEAEHSLLGYGLPDLSAVNLASEAAKEEFRSLVEETIRTFEPRFRSVAVVLREGEEASGRALRLRIEGLLHAEPVPEAVTFDSVLEPLDCSFDVEGGGS